MSISRTAVQLIIWLAVLAPFTATAQSTSRGFPADALNSKYLGDILEKRRVRSGALEDRSFNYPNTSATSDFQPEWDGFAPVEKKPVGEAAANYNPTDERRWRSNNIDAINDDVDGMGSGRAITRGAIIMTEPAVADATFVSVSQSSEDVAACMKTEDNFLAGLAQKEGGTILTQAYHACIHDTMAETPPKTRCTAVDRCIGRQLTGGIGTALGTARSGNPATVAEQAFGMRDLNAHPVNNPVLLGEESINGTFNASSPTDDVLGLRLSHALFAADFGNVPSAADARAARILAARREFVQLFGDRVYLLGETGADMTTLNLTARELNWKRIESPQPELRIGAIRRAAVEESFMRIANMAKTKCNLIIGRRVDSSTLAGTEWNHPSKYGMPGARYEEGNIEAEANWKESHALLRSDSFRITEKEIDNVVYQLHKNLGLKPLYEPEVICNMLTPEAGQANDIAQIIDVDGVDTKKLGAWKKDLYFLALKAGNELFYEVLDHWRKTVIDAGNNGVDRFFVEQALDLIVESSSVEDVAEERRRNTAEFVTTAGGMEERNVSGSGADLSNIFAPKDATKPLFSGQEG